MWYNTTADIYQRFILFYEAQCSNEYKKIHSYKTLYSYVYTPILYVVFYF